MNERIEKLMKTRRLSTSQIKTIRHIDSLARERKDPDVYDRGMDTLMGVNIDFNSSEVTGMFLILRQLQREMEEQNE